MATYSWSTLTNGQSIAFNPSADVLFIDDPSISAAGIIHSFNTTTHITTFTFSGKSVTLQTDVKTLTTSNLVFADGSLFIVGDDTTGTTADDLANTLVGGDGDDRLVGLGGDDSVVGGAGNDVFSTSYSTGSFGNDTIDGGDGFDSLSYSSSSTNAANVNLATHTATSAQGNTTLISIEGANGTAGNDVFTGGDPAHATDAYGDRMGERFRGNGGNDTINGAPGPDYYTIADYAGNSSMQAISANLGTGIVSDGLGGTDTLVNVDEVRGGAGNDVLTGGSLSRATNGFPFESFRGNAGNDTIDGASSDTTLARTDRAEYSNSPFSVVVNLGTVSISGNFYGTGIITVAGGTARDGWDSAGGGTDTLLNIDYVRGSDFNDTLIGGNPLNDDFERLEGGAGNDTLNGGSGADEVTYQNDSAAVTANLALGTATDGRGGTDTLVSIEEARGSIFDDLLIGSNGNNRFEPGPGNDTLDGGQGIDFASYRYTPLVNGGINAFIEDSSGTINDGSGTVDTLINIEGLEGTYSNDTLKGGAGDQWFRGRGGDDTIDGGAGNDWVSYRYDPSGITVNLVAGTAIDGWNGADFGLGGTDTLISIENVEASYYGFADTLIGSDGPNQLRGLGGDDTLQGGLGDDTLDGGAGTDAAILSGNRDAYTIGATTFGYTVSGPDGTDTLIGIESAQFADTTVALDVNFVVDQVITGTPGNDTLVGGDTNDLLRGDAGDDELVGNEGDDVLDGGPGADSMEGGNGNDTYYVDNVGDAVVETSNGGSVALASAAPDAAGSAAGSLPPLTDVAPNALEGFTDTVIAAINYSLANLVFVEDLTLNPDSTAATGTGNALDNALTGNALNNTLTGLAGNDSLDGGAGIDTAVFSGNRSSYTISGAGANVSGPDGADALTDIERLQFANASLAFDLDRGESAGNSVRLIGAAFGTSFLTPEIVGIVIDIFDAGYSLPLVSQAAISVLGSPGNADFVTLLFRNVAEIDPPADALASLVEILDTGLLTQAQMLEIVVNLDLNETHIGLVGMQQNGVEFI